jgi:glycosyltransferase involved in cell wall biosynthesis
MKLLFVINSLGSGGAQRQLVTLARGLKGRGHHVEFFVYSQHDYFRGLLDEVHIPVYLYSKRLRFSAGPIFALRRLVRKQNFDIILSFLDTPNFYSEIACIGLKNIKVVVSHRSMYPIGKLPLKLRFLQEFHRFADAITANSHHQRLRMVQEFPWMINKIHTIYNGLDLQLFSPREIFEAPPSSYLSLIAIGRMFPHKNMMGLAKALIICRDKFKIKPIVRWVGRQDESVSGKKYFEELSSFLLSNNISEQWEWLGERTDISKLLQQHDALIHPSYCEGLPNVVCEALACGLPVLSSNVCDHPSLVEDGVRGFLFDPYKPKSIAESIYKFHRIPSEKKVAMGTDARIYSNNYLSIEQLSLNYENLFLSLKNK